MALTFSQMQTLVADTVDDPSFGYFTLAVVKQRLNLAQRELQGLLVKAGHAYYTRCVKTNTVSGQKAYALPSDFYQLLLLERVTQGSGDTVVTEQIDYITPAQRYQSVEISGLPQMYWFERNNLILKPVPNSIVEIHLEYAYSAVDMSADSDLPDAPEAFHEFIPILASKKCFIKDGRSAQPLQEDLARLEASLKSVADLRRADGPRMTVITDGW